MICIRPGSQLIIHIRPGSQAYNRRMVYIRHVSQPYNKRMLHIRPGSEPYNRRMIYIRPGSQTYNKRMIYIRPGSQPYNKRMIYIRHGSQPSRTAAKGIRQISGTDITNGSSETVISSNIRWISLTDDAQIRRHGYPYDIRHGGCKRIISGTVTPTNIRRISLTDDVQNRRQGYLSNIRQISGTDVTNGSSGTVIRSKIHRISLTDDVQIRPPWCTRNISVVYPPRSRQKDLPGRILLSLPKGYPQRIYSATGLVMISVGYTYPSRGFQGYPTEYNYPLRIPNGDMTETADHPLLGGQ